MPWAERSKPMENLVVVVILVLILANIFPGLRSRFSMKIKKGDSCCNCGLCERTCPVGAIRNGRIHSQCIRCLHCVTNCPQKALQYKNSRVLDAYLRSYCKDEYVLYL